LISDLISDSLRTTALGAAMKGAGLAVRFLPIPQPTILVGPGASARLGQTIAGFGHGKILIVTDSIISKLGLLDELTNALTSGGAEYVVFDAITPDAPIPLIEDGIDFYNEHECDAIVAFGGGSSMDASKAIAAAVSNPGKSLRELAGYFKGLQTPVKIYAVPTTAGTGSEVTVAAVISDPERQAKLVIVDTRLVPKMAALDPCLMTGLPPHITAATGIDALTHAIESFIGKWANSYTDDMALSAVGLIFDNLRVAYSDGKDLAARERMALAATYAGLAFTRANVGYVHAIAHQFGGRYHTPHGLANAIMLPLVLRYSLPAVTGRLALLAVRAKLGKESEGEDALAQKFLEAVEQLNRDLGIPTLPRRAQGVRYSATGRGRLPRSPHRLSGTALHDPGRLRGPHTPGVATRCGAGEEAGRGGKEECRGAKEAGPAHRQVRLAPIYSRCRSVLAVKQESED
jgi:alcohol dehydrogenase